MLDIDRIISIQGSVPDRQEREGHEAAREYLRETGATILIWGGVLRHEGRTIPDLYLTRAAGTIAGSKQYLLETEKEFRLPKVFWEDLSDVLRLVIATQDSELRAKSGHYVVDELRPFIGRVRSILEANAKLTGWHPDAIASTRVILADSLAIPRQQSGQSEPPLAAIASYRQALAERIRARLPLDWATTQNNLGLAPWTLGGRESDTRHLDAWH